jgi:hypothetical protein
LFVNHKCNFFVTNFADGAERRKAQAASQLKKATAGRENADCNTLPIGKLD